MGVRIKVQKFEAHSEPRFHYTNHCEHLYFLAVMSERSADPGPNLQRMTRAGETSSSRKIGSHATHASPGLEFQHLRVGCERVTDVVMPKMRGPELAKRLKGLRNTMRIVYMSGYLEYNRGNEDFLEEGFFLQKPFSRNTLVRKVGEALRNSSRSRT